MFGNNFRPRRFVTWVAVMSAVRGHLGQPVPSPNGSLAVMSMASTSAADILRIRLRHFFGKLMHSTAFLWAGVPRRSSAFRWVCAFLNSSGVFQPGTNI